jgi:alkylation response protein AidB-like acyl-CoA dehydrogenase
VRQDGLHVAGIAGPRLAGSGTAVVATQDGRLALLEPGRLVVAPMHGADPDLGLTRVSGSGLAAGELTGGDWSRALAAGRLALAHELIGAGREMLRLARAHALSRVQFGRPVAAFQAVRHRLADTLLAIESAEALASVAAGSPELSGMAKALAGRSARTVARHCQQVLAGVGFTAEHAFQRYHRRILVLDGLLGGARTLTRELGEAVLRTGRLPTPPPLF